MLRNKDTTCSEYCSVPSRGRIAATSCIPPVKVGPISPPVEDMASRWMIYFRRELSSWWRVGYVASKARWRLYRKHLDLQDVSLLFYFCYNWYTLSVILSAHCHGWGCERQNKDLNIKYIIASTWNGWTKTPRKVLTAVQVWRVVPRLCLWRWVFMQ